MAPRGHRGIERRTAAVRDISPVNAKPVPPDPPASIVPGEYELGLPLLLQHGEADLNQAAHEHLIRDLVHSEPESAL